MATQQILILLFSVRVCVRHRMLSLAYLVKCLTVHEENRVRSPKTTTNWLIVQWIRILRYERRDECSNHSKPTTLACSSIGKMYPAFNRRVVSSNLTGPAGKWRIDSGEFLWTRGKCYYQALVASHSSMMRIRCIGWIIFFIVLLYSIIFILLLNSFIKSTLQ